MKHSLPILLLAAAFLSSCAKETETITRIPEEKLAFINSKEIEQYLAANIGEESFAGVIFCAYDILDNQLQDDQYVLYLWALCQEFYQDHGQISRGTGISLPVAVVLQSQDNNFLIMEYSIPRDGPNYDNDLKTIFPDPVWTTILTTDTNSINEQNERIHALEEKIENNANIYFLSGK